MSGIRVEPIFDKIHPPACHAATLAELSDGLLSVWYSGSYEGSPDTVLYSSRKPQGKPWSKPEVLIDLPEMAVGNPVLHRRGSALWLFFVVLYGDWWTESRIAAMTSADEGMSWSPVRLVRHELGLMTKTAPIEINESLLLPIYDERTWCSMVLVSKDDGRTFELFGDTMGRGVTIQPKIVELSDGRLVMYSRSNKGRVWFSLSYNSGLSWTASQPTEIPNPNSGLDVVRLHGGSLLMVCNDTDRGRGRLSMLLSDDEGVTWFRVCALEESEGEFSYPAILQASNGEIHVCYTRQRVTIAHATLDEESLRAMAADQTSTGWRGRF